MRDRSLLHAQHVYDNREPDDGPPLVIEPAGLTVEGLGRLLIDRGIDRLSVTASGGYYMATAEGRGCDGDGWDRCLAMAIAQAVSECVVRMEAA